MIEKKYILENLKKTQCPRCGSSLEGAEVVSVTEAPLAWVGHAICPACKSENMVTITQSGSGIVPVQSDLTGVEYKKFMGAKAVSYKEVLNLHKTLKRKNVWNLLHKKEKN